MPPRFEKARFHILTGPASLFERVQFKMVNRELKFNADHLQERAIERNAPLEQLRVIRPDSWALKSAEVRTDTGRFISSTWEVTIGRQLWWVVVGLHDTIKTVINIDQGKRGLGESIVTEGDLYDFVEQVNADLMIKETFRG